MDDDREALTVVIAHAETATVQGGPFRNLKFWHALSDAILASDWFAAYIRRKQAAAWDESRRVLCEAEGWEYRKGASGPNPYAPTPAEIQRAQKIEREPEERKG